jgi:hypothetical protein
MLADQHQHFGSRLPLRGSAMRDGDRISRLRTDHDRNSAK